jgi:DNA polymerase III delta subunit
MINVYVGKQKNQITGERVDVLEKNIQQLFDEIQTASLFGDKKTFVLKNVLENENIKKEIFEKLGEVDDAPHDVAILVDKLLVADKKALDKVATIHESVDKEKKPESFNPFGLANAFASGDKKKTWIMFQEVAHHNDEMEPTHGMIWWKLKDMVLKNKKVSPDLKNMARDLVSVYHGSRLGGLDMRERLEKFFLTMSDKK